ncbi:MAG: HlyD family efflux transporter periplasmic adaptor subunit [Burkholderiales bacterium]|nr:HlyD family efflux transporter periplasmic adaptor subunit [Burkholderiales bacterium]
MDQELSDSVKRSRRRKLAMMLTAALLTVSGLSWGIHRLATQSANLSELKISEVRRSALDSTINASGVVIPVREEQLSSPSQSRINKVIAKAGQTVKAGDMLMVLDDKAHRVAIDNLREQVSQQSLRVQVLQQEMDANLRRIASEIELLELDLQSNQVKLNRFKKLGATGITSQVDVQAAELAVKRNEVQLRQHRESLLDVRKTALSNIASAHLQKSIFQKQMELQESMLAQTQVKAPFDGIVTWTLGDEGASVSTGQLIAKVSELRNFKVEAKVSDFYARHLNPGQAVKVETSGQVLMGQVQTVLPEIQNGSVKLIVNLDQPNHPALRHQLRVETNIIIAQKEQALVVDMGAAINGQGRQDVFVIQDGQAVKRQLEFGAGNGKMVEVVAGAKEGSKIIISDVNKFKHLDRFTVR